RRGFARAHPGPAVARISRRVAFDGVGPGGPARTADGGAYRGDVARAWHELHQIWRAFGSKRLGYGELDRFRRYAQSAMGRARRADCVGTVAARLRHD